MKKTTGTNFENFEKFAVKNPEKIFGGMKWEGRRESTNTEDGSMPLGQLLVYNFNAAYSLEKKYRK